MTIEEILSLKPQHIDELRSFYAVCPFDNVEIFARETADIEQHLGSFATKEFEEVFLSYPCQHPVSGINRTHLVFADPALTPDTFIVSYASDGEIEDRVIFRIIVK